MPIKTPTVFTIGFTKKPASAFFELLRNAGVKRVIDIRLNNVSQLAGFSKKEDLRYFLREIHNIDYVHEPLLAPTQAMRDWFKKHKNQWPDYSRDFLGLMKERHVEDKIDPNIINGACLLCSEHEPHCCHRRLVAEYLHDKWDDLQIVHLK